MAARGMPCSIGITEVAFGIDLDTDSTDADHSFSSDAADGIVYNDKNGIPDEASG